MQDELKPQYKPEVYVETNLGQTSSLVHNSLQPIKELFGQSWEAFTKSILALLKLSVVGLVVNIGAILITSISLVVLGFSQFQNLLKISKVENLQPDQLLTLGSPLIFFSVFLLLLLIVTVVINSAIGAAQILVIDRYTEIQPVSSLLRRGLNFIIPLFITGLFVSLIIFGGFFFLVIPAIIFSLFFSFVPYSIVLDNQKILGALKRSYLIVSNHFGEIFIRWLILVGVYLLVVFLIPGLISKIDESTAIVIYLFSFFINILLGWYMLAYNIVLYKQAREKTDLEKKVSLRWIWLITLLGFVIALLLAVAMYRTFTSDLFKNFVKQARKGIEKSATFTNSNLVEQTFKEVEAYRVSKGLPTLQESSPLCAYASRRLEQLTSLGKFDDGRGFYEDIVNPSIRYAYFLEFDEIDMNYYSPITSFTKPQDIVNYWATGNEKSVLHYKFNAGCIRANEGLMVLVVGTTK